MTYYDVLEVHPGAVYGEIKTSYRRLVKRYHPDLNPSDFAKERIVLITEAYEYLSDPIKRSNYDALLQAQTTKNAYYRPTAQPKARSERDIKKQEFIKRRRAQEQHNWEQLFKLKVKFYKLQRYFAFIFVLISLIYSWDYYFLENKGAFKLDYMGMNRFGECGVLLSGQETYLTTRAFYDDLSLLPEQDVTVFYSRIHEVPVALGLGDEAVYKIYDTVHSFNNFFGFLLGFLGVFLIVNHKYSDWLLTIGFLPFFITMFLLLLTLTTKMSV